MTLAGIAHEVRATDVPEIRDPGESPESYVRRLARQKAEAVPRAGHETVLAADTVVVLDDRVLEKPSDRDDAVRMLHALQGREHHVLTGFCLIGSLGQVVEVERTKVRFAPMSRAEIEEYAASGEPMDKAGAYAIQGLASKFVAAIEGDYANVVGLPVARVYQYLKALQDSRVS